MSIFAFYFATELLQEAGWPRKLGRFKGVGYDATMVDMAFAQSIDWGASLGAGRPEIALQMIANMFRDRDWEGAEAPDVKVFVEGRRGDEAQHGPWQTADAPQEAVPSRVHFADGMSSLTHEQFLELKRPTEPDLFNALLWGLDNPDRVGTWHATQTAEYESKLPLMRKAGLEVGEPSSLSEYLESCEQVVHNYERDLDPLPSPPARLLADAEALGWRT